MIEEDKYFSFDLIFNLYSKQFIYFHLNKFIDFID